jgi:polyisoprenoid-binding protein YceI
MHKLLIGILSSTIFLAACEDPSANKPKATTTEYTTNANATTANTGTATATKQSETLAINNENSKVSFVGSKVTGKHDGGFNKFTGTINLVDGKPEESSVNVDIDVSSVFTDTDALTKHLQTGDFFDVANHPKATFSSTKIVPDGAGADGYTITGDLELRGVKKSVTFPATIKVGYSVVEVNSEFSINRKDFNILYAGKADDLIRDNVVLKLDLKAQRKK